MRKLLIIGAVAAFTASAAELSEAEVDRLCPPRAETAAEFKAGTYPPAARPYREAALKAFAYMASLPAMRTLVEKGEPEQTYQHNAYVSKTHAAHINLMLEWARREPARRRPVPDHRSLHRFREEAARPVPLCPVYKSRKI